MSAKDDAANAHSHRSPFRLTIALAIVAGAAVGALAALVATPADRPFFESRIAWSGPAPSEFERLSRAAGESLRLEAGADGPVLVVSAARAPRARALAAGLLAEPFEAASALVAARDSLAVRAAATLPAERPVGSRADSLERCAAWLLARAGNRKELIAAAPAPWGGTSADAAPAAPAAVLERANERFAALERLDADALAAALVAEARAEDEWFASGVPAASAPLAARAAAWSAWQRARADSLDAMASRLLAGSPPASAARLAREVDRAALALTLRLPRPYEGLVRAMQPAWAPAVAPLLPAWRGWIGMGAIAGSTIAAILALIVAAWLRWRRTAAEWFAPAREPALDDRWLHVVAGPNPSAIGRAVVELAAHGLARGQRVLVVDGSARLRLHERFGREARWGLMECLLADMPVVGLVQYGGRPGFYLLAHGNTLRSDGWAALGRRLDDARPHFGRIVLAIDFSAPRALGDSLLGRDLSGWWAEAARRLPRGATELTSRLGIAFSGIDLSGVPQPTLEVLAGRTKALALDHPDGPARPLPPVARAPFAAAVPVPSEPLVLDCDLQMRQRLRFLAWMRQVQSERRRAEVAVETEPETETVLQ